MNVEQVIIVLIAISIGILGGIAHATNNRLDELEKKTECHIMMAWNIDKCLEDKES